MSMERLDHITIKASDLDASIAFYEEVLGLKSGDRPPFSFPGAWIYCGDRPVVHIVTDRPTETGTGSIDHIAFQARDAAAFVARLEAAGVEFSQRDVPGMALRQVFLTDPDGVKVEINFPI